jgi:lipopolysaccharide export LptBFGC system permease protein LptF
MIYKTLHWYITKELLRIFILAASALTTLLAFCGLFKPLTKAGLDVVQLMKIMFELMPAMLAYSIPLAALYAAVLVYWRMSTDNEVLACRSGGISFGAIVLPALVLGMVISLTDFMFVNYVVPVFLQKVETSLRKDMGSLLAFSISHQEAFKFSNKVVYADSAQLIHVNNGGVDEVVVRLNGVAATMLNRDKKPSVIVVAQQALVHFIDMPEKDEIDAWIQITNGAAFDPVTFRKYGGSVDRLPATGSYPIPSPTGSRPKFEKLDELWKLAEHPNDNPGIADVLAKMAQTIRYQRTSANYAAAIDPGDTIRFEQLTGDYVVVHVPRLEMSPERALSFTSAGGHRVQVDEYQVDEAHVGKLRMTYKCDNVTLTFSDEEFPSTHVAGALELHGTPKSPVIQKDWVLDVPETPTDPAVTIQPLDVSQAKLARNGVPIADLHDMVAPLPVLTVAELSRMSATGELTAAVNGMMTDVEQKISELLRLIKSEQHSRGSFALSCLTLVLLGAALGIMLRGRNPLAVFVVGVVPAILLVLLITAGRRMVEWSDLAAPQGYAILWLGNVILAIMVVGIYAKLLRQ